MAATVEAMGFRREAVLAQSLITSARSQGR
jgi:hypothetical protein